jgi:hypothetical protein
MSYRNNQAIIISKLREYNQWRRGDDEIKQPDPFQIGAYIDDICDIAENLERQRDEAMAVANDLASAASHCLGWNDCRLNIGEKIAATLQRWSKLKEAMK